MNYFKFPANFQITYPFKDINQVSSPSNWKTYKDSDVMLLR